MIVLYLCLNALHGVTLVYCAKCGAENSDDSSVCINCGAILGPSQPSRIVRSKPRSSSLSPSLIIGVIIIIVGVTFSVGVNFGQLVGEWGESFGDSMGTWGENFGESMGAWGENIGRTFSDWGMGFGRYFGALLMIVIGLFIVTRSFRRPL